MKYSLLKAQAKKNKYLNNSHINKDEEHDDEALSSDDEETVNSMIGEIFNNNYICIKYLGKGTFAKVWLVYDIKDNNLKVAKHYNDENLDESKNEIKILNKIKNCNNPNIIKFYEYFSYEKYGKINYVIIFELLGISLLNLINDINSIMEDEKEVYIEKINIDYIKKIMKDVINSLDSLHKLNIIHADLKLDNILLDILPYNISSLKNYVNN